MRERYVEYNPDTGYIIQTMDTIPETIKDDWEEKPVILSFPEGTVVSGKMVDLATLELIDVVFPEEP